MIFRIALMANLGLIVSLVLNWALGWDWNLLLLALGFVVGGAIPILVAYLRHKS